MKPYIFSFFLCLLLLQSCNSSKAEENNNEISASKVVSQGVNVSVQNIIPSVFQKQIISNGLIEASQKSELRFKTSEHIAVIKVKNGQKVAKGQVIAQLENEVVLNQLSKTQIELAKAKTKLQEEKINYGLDNEKEIDIDATVLRNLHIKSGYLEAKNALENAELIYKQTFLRAPISGVVANIETKAGSFITSGDVFCTIINQNNMEVLFSVQENELQVIKKNQEISITPFAHPDKDYQGTITEINPMVGENGLVKIRAKVKSTTEMLFDGMNAKVLINRPIEDVIVVPKEALVLRSNKEVVFTVENGLAKWNYVKVLDQNSNSYAINEGLKVGDTIIVSGNMNLSHDAKVNITFNEEE